MSKAITISLILHLSIFVYMVWGESRPRNEGYPKIMTVDLVSLPPISKGIQTGTETPGSPQDEAEKAKLQSKVETKPDTPHVAEVQKQKKEATKKPQPKPQTNIEKAEKAGKTKSGKAGEEGERFGLPEGIETGSEFGGVRLDGGNFETPTFLNILFAKIKNRWDNPFQGADKVFCTIYFTIMRDGTIVDAIIEQSSGIPAFDQSALRAVMAASPPPLPLEYTGNSLGIHLQFQYIP